MHSLLSRYATPLVTGLFVVSLVSGIALFFHFQSGAFHSMHEWLSMVLILPFILHIWKNWRPFQNYFKRLPMALAIGVSIAASIPFAWPALTSTGPSTGNPAVAMAGVITGSPAAEVAPLFDQTEEAFLALLSEGGFPVSDARKTLREIAAESGKTDRDVVALLASMRK
ncbi:MULTISPECIES: DUF4405 domain-containing protein [Pseudorhizobium]|jgi:hypothetical protein|uniref:DUF4405 domain-containing protein n=3 Tax=Pseudorhizobium TaxID=1903858 RepID=A0A7W9YUL4_9HYPH|nr:MULTISPECIES: DUF4405 domain-containing protein [Pseudorhizobium]MBB6178692.1 hypothetical protein [Pseudorhizobium flavum]CAD6603251.1 hypothetical protein RKHAN_01331 [Rhizobium sp. Khangiran2]CAD6608967.1 hypothetical protein RFYW14_02166 [Pseudorhizobium flavum]CAD7037283.1 hypothetical protein RHAB21_02637 [Pseudorhizobium halotolerans]